MTSRVFFVALLVALSSSFCGCGEQNGEDSWGGGSSEELVLRPGMSRTYGCCKVEFLGVYAIHSRDWGRTWSKALLLACFEFTNTSDVHVLAGEILDFDRIEDEFENQLSRQMMISNDTVTVLGLVKGLGSQEMDALEKKARSSYFRLSEDRRFRRWRDPLSANQLLPGERSLTATLFDSPDIEKAKIVHGSGKVRTDNKRGTEEFRFSFSMDEVIRRER